MSRGGGHWCARQSWRDPAGVSPAREKGSANPVVSVASWKATTTAKHTQEAYTAGVRGVGMSHEMANTQGPRRSMASKAIFAAPLCEAPSPCRGLRPHHVHKDRVGTWETSCRPKSHLRLRAATGSRGDEAVGEGVRSRTAAYYL